MKKTIARLLCLLITLVSASGCAREEFMDLYGFTERFAYEKLSVEDFYFEESKDDDSYYYTFFEKDNPKVMLKLLCTENNKISQVRIYLPKYDENAHKKNVSTEEILLFVNVADSSICALTGWSESQSHSIAEEMLLYEKSTYEKDGELTKTKGNFHFVYHSALLGSEFIIYNTYLVDVPQTEKPESRPLYGDTTKIRTETVPTK